MDEKEKELVRRALAGENSAFEELALSYRQSLLHLAYRMTGNMEEAMDIAQETLLRSFKYLHRFNPERGFRNWLFQIAANQCRDFGRRKEAEKRYRQKISGLNGQEINAGNNGPGIKAVFHEASPATSDLKLDVNRYLNRLGPKERRVFILRDLEGLSIGETAGVLGISSISVRVNLSSARKKIKQLILGLEEGASGRGEAK